MRQLLAVVVEPMLKKLVWILVLVVLYWQSDLTSTSVFDGVIAPLACFLGTVILIFSTVLNYFSKGRAGSSGSGGSGLIGTGASVSPGGCNSESSSDSGAGGDGCC